MADEDPRKLEEIRRFSAIYGRFDCKRKPEKPLTLHEVGFFTDLRRIDSFLIFENMILKSNILFYLDIFKFSLDRY